MTLDDLERRKNELQVAVGQAMATLASLRGALAECEEWIARERKRGEEQAAQRALNPTVTPQLDLPLTNGADASGSPH